jgi:hypothetical protein
MQPQPFRIDPALPVGAYQTYSITAPHDRTIRAACEEVGCANWLNGWKTVIDESSEQGRAQAAYIRHQSGRTFREQQTGEGLTVFTFDSHQRCFADHRTRPETYAVRDGDWRGNPTGRRRIHANAQDWTEDFGEHQQRIADQHERG